MEREGRKIGSGRDCALVETEQCREAGSWEKKEREQATGTIRSRQSGKNRRNKGLEMPSASLQVI